MWFLVALFIGSLVLGMLLAPKPQNAKASGLGDITAPIAEEGVEIPVLFGTRDFNGPNVIWYGDLSVQPIKSKGGKK